MSRFCRSSSEEKLASTATSPSTLPSSSNAISSTGWSVGCEASSSQVDVTRPPASSPEPPPGPRARPPPAPVRSRTLPAFASAYPREHFAAVGGTAADAAGEAIAAPGRVGHPEPHRPRRVEGESPGVRRRPTGGTSAHRLQSSRAGSRPCTRTPNNTAPSRTCHPAGPCGPPSTGPFPGAGNRVWALPTASSDAEVGPSHPLA